MILGWQLKSGSFSLCAEIFSVLNVGRHFIKYAILRGLMPTRNPDIVFTR